MATKAGGLHWPHWHEIFTLGVEAAAKLGDLAQHATQLNYLAWVHLVPPGEPETVARYATQALDFATRSGATAQIAWAHQYIEMALRKLGRFDEAVASSSSRAAEMFKTAGDMDAYCQCVGAIGDALLEDGRYNEALEQLLKRYDLASDVGSGMTPTIAAFTLPYALARVGECLGSLGRRAEAITALTEAVAIFEQAQSPDFKHANALERLAAVLAEEGRTGESRRTYARAAAVFEAIGDTEASGRCRDLATTAAPAENVIRPSESFGGSYGPGQGGMSEQVGVVVREAVTTG